MKLKSDYTFRRVESIGRSMMQFVASETFFKIIALLAVLQGVWFAIMFVPGIFDEVKHLSHVFIYADGASPFVSEQAQEWDYAGPIFRDPYYFYYIIMAIPLKIIRLFTEDYAMQIFILRLINVSFFVSGLYAFKRALQEARVFSKSIINVSLALLVVTPAFAPLPGAVNYDNLAFLLTGLFMLYAIRVLRSSKPDYKEISLFLVVCLLLVMTKWTLAILCIPALAIVGFNLGKKHGKQFLTKVKRSFDTTGTYFKVGSIVAIVILSGLIIERHVTNIVRYGGSAQVQCTEIMSLERCLSFHDFAVYHSTREAKPDSFEPMGVHYYGLSMFAPRMINTQTTLLPWRATELTPAIPPLGLLYFIFASVATVAIIVGWRRLVSNDSTRLLLFTSLSFVLLLMFYLYSLYAEYAIPAAISARYLIPVIPFIIALSLLVIKKQSPKKWRPFFPFLVLLSGLLLTQGGSIISYSLTADRDLIRQNDKVMTFEEYSNKVFRKIVINDSIVD